MADMLCPPPLPEEQESIYHWLPTRVEGSTRTQLRYTSNFHPSVQREMEEKKKAPCQTMGIPKLQVPTPKDYLRKHSKERKVPKCMYEQPKRLPVKAQVPPQSDRPLMGIQSEKNFIHANVAEAIMAVAKKPLHACIDQRRGDKYLLDGSGLVQKYLKKKDFGVTPNYILGHKKEAAEERQERVAARRECLQKRRLTRLSSREREDILNGLKTNWEDLNKDFQSLSVEMTTIPQRLRKEKLELEMKQLEDDIGVLDKRRFVYVAGE